MTIRFSSFKYYFTRTPVHAECLNSYELHQARYLELDQFPGVTKTVYDYTCPGCSDKVRVSKGRIWVLASCDSCGTKVKLNGCDSMAWRPRSDKP